MTTDVEPVDMKIARMLGVMAREAAMPRDGSGALAQITHDIMSANTADDILDAAELGGTSLEDLVGVPLLFKAVEWAKSTIEASDFDYFAILTFEDLINHEEVITTSGAKSIILQAFALSDGGMLPHVVEVKQKTAAGSGNDFYYFGRLSKANARYAPKAKAE